MEVWEDRLTAISIPSAPGPYERPGSQPEGGRGSQFGVGPPWVIMRAARRTPPAPSASARGSLDLQQVRRPVQHEGLRRCGSQLEQQVLALAIDAARCRRRERPARGARDARGRIAIERPRHDRGELLAEERVRVGHGLLERARDRAARARRAIGGAADAAHEGVDGPGLSPAAVPLAAPAATTVSTICRCSAVGGAGRAASSSASDCTASGASTASWSAMHRARGVADDVRALDPEVVHQRPAVRGLLGEGGAGPSTPVAARHSRRGGSARTRYRRPAPAAPAAARRSRRQTPAWMSTTGSPAPRTSYSSSRPSIGARSTCPPV